MKQQYTISFDDRMHTYGIANANASFMIEGICGTINSECERGATFLQCLYVDGRPSILVFEKDV